MDEVNHFSTYELVVVTWILQNIVKNFCWIARKNKILPYVGQITGKGEILQILLIYLKSCHRYVGNREVAAPGMSKVTMAFEVWSCRLYFMTIGV